MCRKLNFKRKNMFPVLQKIFHPSQNGKSQNNFPLVTAFYKNALPAFYVNDQTHSFSFSEISSGSGRPDSHVNAAADWATRKWKQPSDEHDAFLMVTDRLWDIRTPGTKHFQFTKILLLQKGAVELGCRRLAGRDKWLFSDKCVKTASLIKASCCGFDEWSPNAQRWAVPDALITRSIAPHIKLLKRGLSLFILF